MVAFPFFFFLFLKVSQIRELLKRTLAWHGLCGCRVCEQARKCNPLQSPGNFYFKEKQTCSESREHCSLQTVRREVEPRKADGLAIRKQFSLTHGAVFMFLVKYQILSLLKLPRKAELAAFRGVVPWHLPFLVLVSILSFSLIFHCSFFPSQPGQDFYYVFEFTAHMTSVWPSCTDLMEKSTFPFCVSHFSSLQFSVAPKLS